MTSSSPALRAPKQERSRRTLDRLVTAALELIGERGVEATSVHDIVRRARSSVGSFYARFEGKDELLAYLEEHLWHEALERWEAALESADWDGRSLEDLARPIVRLILETYRVGARQRAILAARRPGGGGPDPARAFHVSLRHGLRTQLLSRSDAIRHPDPSLAVDVVLRVLVGAVREIEEDAVLNGALPGVTDQRLVDELSLLMLAYLGGNSPGSGPGAGQIEFFDVWG